MSARGRSRSPKPLSPVVPRDKDAMDVSPPSPPKKQEPKYNVIVVSGLTRNVHRGHLEEIFGEYGDVTGVDLPVIRQSGLNRGKAAIEFGQWSGAKKALDCMNGGQLDGSVLTVVISEHPLPAPRPASPPRRSRSRSPPPRRRINSRSRSPPPRRRRSYSRSRSPPRRGPGGPGGPGGYGYGPNRGGYGGPRGGGGGGGGFRNDRRGPSPPPVRPYGNRGAPRRRSPSYERGGRRSPVRSRSRSRSRSPVSRSRSRSRSRSPSRSRSRSPVRRKRSYTRSSSRSRSRSPRSRSRSKSRSYSRSISKSPVRK